MTSRERNTRRIASQEQATSAFVARKAKIDAALETLVAASENHFNVSPDELGWMNVGTLDHVEERLAELLAFLNLPGGRERA